MTDHEHVPSPTELIYTPRPSWGPAFFALGLALALCGIFSTGFFIPHYIFTLTGLIILVATIRSLLGGTIRDFFRLPKSQRVRGAVLPAASLSTAHRDQGSA